MRSLLISLMGCAALGGCNAAVTESGHGENRDPATRITKDQIQFPQVKIPDAVGKTALSGEYYRGDGLGYNISLSLHPSGTYEAIWTGCLGTYGTARGSWNVEGNRLQLAPSEAEGMMKDHLNSLDVLDSAGELILIPTDDNDFFLKYGPSSFSCFTKVRER